MHRVRYAVSDKGQPVNLTEYLDKVASYWDSNGIACDRCPMYYGECALLHDSKIPEGPCLGLLQEGIKRGTGDDYDPTPWCSWCGAKEKKYCDCVIADNH